MWWSKEEVGLVGNKVCLDFEPPDKKKKAKCDFLISCVLWVIFLAVPFLIYFFVSYLAPFMGIE